MQFSHLPPSVPHWVSAVPGAQFPKPVQQPWHEIESQTHWPIRQRLPTAHCASVPHRHAPEVHWSDRAGSHTVHGPPDVPHVVVLCIMHVFDEQQPFGHVPALQLPPVHAPPAHVPGLQSWHIAPMVPQLAFCVPLRHVAPSQQPAQVAESHAHEPAEQRVPGEHGAPLPHMHTPFAQLSARGPHGEQLPPPVPHWLSWFTWHTPPWQQPFGQLV